METTENRDTPVKRARRPTGSQSVEEIYAGQFRIDIKLCAKSELNATFQLIEIVGQISFPCF